MTDVASSLTPLLVALDHLDEDTRSSLQRLADRVSLVCKDQGVAVSPDQALNVAQRAMAPLPDAQTAQITAHLKDQPLTLGSWTDAKASAKKALTKRWRQVIALLGGCVFIPGLIMVSTALLEKSSPPPHSVVVVSILSIVLGVATGAIGFITVGDPLLKPRQQVWKGLQEADPEDGWDHFRGKHWSESTQAVATYHRLKQPDVPLLERDLDLLLEVAQADWDDEESRAIQQRLKSSPLNNREPA